MQNEKKIREIIGLDRGFVFVIMKSLIPLRSSAFAGDRSLFLYG